MKIIKFEVTRDKALKIWNKYRKENKLFLKMLYDCGCNRCNDYFKLGIHHKDGDKLNNNVNNFEVLCFKCHCLLHNKEFKVKYTNDYIYSYG